MRAGAHSLITSIPHHRFFSADERPSQHVAPHVAKPVPGRVSVAAAPPVVQPWRASSAAAQKPSSAPPERYFGVVERVKAENGYGFIRVHELNTSVFYHVNQLLNRQRELEEGDEVEFQLEDNARSGKMCCARIRLVAPVSSRAAGASSADANAMDVVPGKRSAPASSSLSSFSSSSAHAHAQLSHAPSSKVQRSAPPAAPPKLHRGTITKVAADWGYVSVDAIVGDATAAVGANRKLFFNSCDVIATRALAVGDKVVFHVNRESGSGESACAIDLADSAAALEALSRPVPLSGAAEPFYAESLFASSSSSSSSSSSAFALPAAPLLPASSLPGAKLASNPLPRGDQSYFIRSQQVPHDEDREHEFKSMERSHSLEDSVAFVGPKYINAFLNSRGGTLYFGIADNGNVHGLTVDRCVSPSC